METGEEPKGYLTDEALAALVRDVEEHTLVTAPPRIRREVSAHIKERRRASVLYRLEVIGSTAAALAMLTLNTGLSLSASDGVVSGLRAFVPSLSGFSETLDAAAAGIGRGADRFSDALQEMERYVLDTGKER